MLKMIGHFEAARGRFSETEGFVRREATGGPPQELAALGIQEELLMLKMLGLVVPAASEVILRPPEAIF